jgi:hypothetical protein
VPSGDQLGCPSAAVENVTRVVTPVVRFFTKTCLSVGVGRGLELPPRCHISFLSHVSG